MLIVKASGEIFHNSRTYCHYPVLNFNRNHLLFAEQQYSSLDALGEFKIFVPKLSLLIPSSINMRTFFVSAAVGLRDPDPNLGNSVGKLFPLSVGGHSGSSSVVRRGGGRVQTDGGGGSHEEEQDHDLPYKEWGFQDWSDTSYRGPIEDQDDESRKPGRQGHDWDRSGQHSASPGGFLFPLLVGGSLVVSAIFWAFIYRQREGALIPI